jgi:DNA polymerase I-like protein with 3'-5' exonuclease and polymerase domains
MVKWIRKKKMRSRIVGQIHDSLVADVHKDELDEYLSKVKQVMTEDVREAWDWVIVPLEIEAEVTETNWHSKVSVPV